MGLYTEILGSPAGTGAIDGSRLAQLTNAGQPQASSSGSSGINTTRLQQAVYYAQAYFATVTGIPYDDTTVNAAGPPLVVNQAHPIGISLVVAILYRWRGLPDEAQHTKAAWEQVTAELRVYMKSVGVGRYVAPGSDSVFTPSTPTGPQPILPDMDRLNLDRMAINDPGPWGSGGYSQGFALEFGL
jgi:hypothetical protein